MSERLSASQKVLSGAAAALVLTACSEGKTTAQDNPREASIVGVEAGTVGYDVSFPQCDTALPEEAPFAIVGLNGTLANNFNECFRTQIEWARKSKAAMYVHIGNPGSKLASVWPQDGSNRYGTCEGDDSLACDYEYGAMLAKNDLQVANKHDAGKLPIWLDVETNYSWFFKDKPRNVAAMEGMVSVFQENGSAVGIYSDVASWRRIAGDTLSDDSELKGLPNWVLGANSRAEAEANCDTTGFTGEVVLAQMAGDDYPIDKNLVC